MKKLALLIALLTTTATAQENELHYSKKWCVEHGGTESVTLPSRHEVDCVLRTHAVEVEWAPKYREGIGQALDYAQQTELAPGLVLLLRPGEERGVNRALAIIQQYNLPIRVWVKEVTP